MTGLLTKRDVLNHSARCENCVGSVVDKLSKTKKCTYDVILRGVCATAVAVEKQYVLHVLSVCL